MESCEEEGGARDIASHEPNDAKSKDHHSLALDTTHHTSPKDAKTNADARDNK